MAEPTASEADLLRWSEALAGIARTGLGFTQSLYERERFEEVLAVAADIKVAASHLREQGDDVPEPRRKRRGSFDSPPR